VAVGSDRHTVADAGVEQVEEQEPADRYPPPPPDRPGENPKESPPDWRWPAG
jgi:hypothetical protein